MSRVVSGLALVALVIGGAIVMLAELTGTPTRKPSVAAPLKPAQIRQYDVVAEYPHNQNTFTQGLSYAGGFLYESTGREDQSSIRKVELDTGRVVEQHDVDRGFLGEGLTEWRGQLIQLTPMRTRPNLIHSMTQRDFDFVVASFGRYLNL